jgi:dTDP-D-glucose 4,6-dehydratase
MNGKTSIWCNCLQNHGWKLGRAVGTSEIDTYVKDRQDMIYACDWCKQDQYRIMEASVTFERLERTVNWYLENQIWLNNITQGVWIITRNSIINGQWSVFSGQFTMIHFFFKMT